MLQKPLQVFLKTLDVVLFASDNRNYDLSTIYTIKASRPQRSNRKSSNKPATVKNILKRANFLEWICHSFSKQSDIQNMKNGNRLWRSIRAMRNGVWLLWNMNSKAQLNILCMRNQLHYHICLKSYHCEDALGRSRDVSVASRYEFDENIKMWKRYFKLCIALP